MRGTFVPAPKTLLVALLSLGVMANVGLFVVEHNLRAEKEQLLQEQIRLRTELGRFEALHPSLRPAHPERIPRDFSIEMVHVGPHGCGRVALYRRPGEMMASADARMPDGSQPEPMSLITCGACGWVGPQLEARPRATIPVAVEGRDEKP